MLGVLLLAVVTVVAGSAVVDEVMVAVTAAVGKLQYSSKRYREKRH